MLFAASAFAINHQGSYNASNFMVNLKCTHNDGHIIILMMIEILLEEQLLKKFSFLRLLKTTRCFSWNCYYNLKFMSGTWIMQIFQPQIYLRKPLPSRLTHKLTSLQSRQKVLLEKRRKSFFFFSRDVSKSARNNNNESANLAWNFFKCKQDTFHQCFDP